MLPLNHSNKENKKDMKAFETSQSYGNDLTIKVIKRTSKTITIDTSFGIQRIKVRGQENGLEYISFKCWLIYASDNFDMNEAVKIANEKAYYS
jgi:hypothetical protein